MTERHHDGATEIHQTASVDPKAELASGVRIGPYAVIGGGVRVGRDTQIGPHVIIEGNVEIGERCQLYAGVVVGTPPQDLKYREGTHSGVRIGNENRIREYVTIHRASVEDGWTMIGDGNFIMAGSHIAHDCRLGDGIVIVNYTGLTGFVEVEDRAVISGLTGILPYCRVGTMAYIGGWTKVVQDVPPYFVVEGNPAEARAVNVVGLRRNDVPAEIRLDLQRAFKLLYRSGLNRTQAIERIKSEITVSEPVMHLVEFIQASKRGVC